MEGFDLGLWNWFSLGLSTALDDFVKDAASLRTSPVRRGKYLEEVLLADASSGESFGNFTFSSKSLLFKPPLVTSSDDKTSCLADGRKTS